MLRDSRCAFGTGDDPPLAFGTGDDPPLAFGTGDDPPLRFPSPWCGGGDDDDPPRLVLAGNDREVDKGGYSPQSHIIGYSGLITESKGAGGSEGWKIDASPCRIVEETSGQS